MQDVLPIGTLMPDALREIDEHMAIARGNDLLERRLREREESRRRERDAKRVVDCWEI